MLALSTVMSTGLFHAKATPSPATSNRCLPDAASVTQVFSALEPSRPPSCLPPLMVIRSLPSAENCGLTPTILNRPWLIRILACFSFLNVCVSPIVSSDTRLTTVLPVTSPTFSNASRLSSCESTGSLPSNFAVSSPFES